ncbi:glycosyltransferase [Anaeromyxobacter paludicola]|uniref:Glycosyltransferase n=1 Tax=Anaeromyxobacter paludicola TaxID=2918171 RepID=A0ABM7X5U2_9BACT|nr:glycosyltransferase [Anaeromyxobacter paludicola]BDG07184.1 hypothetical protein AMPC_02970 [Anaeromyxobacter paludicola]
MEFTGERLIPGQVEGDLWAEHYSRYLFVEPLAAGKRVLDLGTGAGYGAHRLAGVAAAVTGVDLSAEAVAWASERYAAPNLRYLQGDARSVPLPDASFDLVVCFEMIEHVAEQEAVLREVRRLLAPGGAFVVSTPNRRYYTDERHEENAFHVREFDVPEFDAFLRGFFPHVGLYLQNHVPALVIGAGGPASAVGAAKLARASSPSPEEAAAGTHYAVAVCSDGPVALEELVFLPEGAGNVLRTREQHLQRALAELEKSRADFARAEAEAEDRTAWARRLEAELGTAGAEVRRLQGELEERTRWAQSLDAELGRARQALRAPEPVAAAPRRSLLRRAGRALLPPIAAAAAVPLAAGLGAAAVGAELAGRLLPRRPRLPSLVPPDHRHATVLVLNYNGRDLLEKNVPHLQAALAEAGGGHQLLVVDNGSDDGSVELLRERFPDVDVLPLARNWFFSAGNDLGVPAVRHDVLVLLNNDMRVERDFLAPLLAPFAEDPDLFAVASQILMAPGKRQEETGLARARWANGRIEFRHDPVPPGQDARPIPILWAGGGAAAFDKRKFVELGGLDLLYDPFYCEDSDLSLRAWARGWKVLFAPASKVWHDHRTTSRRVFGEGYVEEITRRNTLLLHWANLRDLDLLAEHAGALPRIAWAWSRDFGLKGVRSIGRACARAPRALARRLRERAEGPSLREILDCTDAGADPRPARALRPRRAGGEPLKVTMVAPYHLYPVQHGGAVRMYNVVRELSRRGHAVSVVGFVDNEEQLEGGRHLQELCAEVKLLVRDPSPKRGGLLDPGEVTEFQQLAFQRLLGEHVERFDPDVLQVEYTHMAPYARYARGRVTALTEHDIAFMSAYRHALAERGTVGSALAYQRYLRLFRFELEALRRFDLVLAVTPRDAELLRAYAGPGVTVSDRAPTGVDVAAWSGLERRPDGRTALFVGNFQHRPNADALLHFARRVLPELHRRDPEVRLRVVGPHAPPEIRALADDPRVEVLGFVPDLREVYATAGAFVSPIRVAAGVRVKLMEAFAAGVPCVSTSPGAEGLAVAHERELLLADDPAAFAEQTLRLLRDPALGARLAGEARRLVEDHYSWPAIVAALEEEYRAALARKHEGRKTA